jgi:hypothetical protein
MQGAAPQVLNWGTDRDGLQANIHFFSAIVFTVFATLFSPLFQVFFSIKMAESRKIVLGSCNIDFDDVQV